jgi:hypothetical protein
MSRPGDGEVVDLADRDAGGDAGRVEGRQAGQPGEQGAQRDFTVQPCKRGAEAEVRSGGEAEVRVGVAADVEPVRVREGGGVTVSGTQEQQARLPGRARNAVDVGVGAGCCSGECGRGNQPNSVPAALGGPAEVSQSAR